MSESMLPEIAKAAKVAETDAMLVIEEFLIRLHKLEFERDKGKDDFVSKIWWQISPRAFYHLLGFIESFAEEGDSWQPGTIVEYLGRMPPCERWEELSKEMKDWKRKSK